MFERFTNTARHVVVLSQEEARQLSHNYIGTEHILLGLLGEPDSVAGKVLAGFGFTLDRGRTEVEAKVGRGKKAPGGHIPFTPRAKKVLELSLREALSLGHNYIGTEHILLGLIREGDGVAAQVLGGHADVVALRAAVIDAVPAAEAADPEDAEDTNNVLRWLRHRLTRRSVTSVPLRVDPAWGEAPARGTPAAEAALAQAATLAGPLPVGSHHLLLAALADSSSAASAALASVGVNVDELKEKLRTVPVAGTSDELPQEAGRRQMTLTVSDEVLTIAATDPVIVAAAREALDAVNAGVPGSAESGGAAAGAQSATSTAISGDHPAAAGLANVWLELRKTLKTLADAAPPAPAAPGAAEAGSAEPGSAEPGSAEAGSAEAGA
jgi:ATP-dependent Clp protease ATP-binding subunit ClpC